MSIHIDSFSGPVADLKPAQRTETQVLYALMKNPRVSTWDMSGNPWLCRIIASLETQGFIEHSGVGYPWHKYSVTENARAALARGEPA